MSQQQTVFRSFGKTIKEIKSVQEHIPNIDKPRVLIKIKSVALNYRDIAVATDCYPFPANKEHVPCPGSAGVVINIGRFDDSVVAPFDPTHFYGVPRELTNQYGDPQDGVLLQYKVVPAITVIRLPKDTYLFYAETVSLVYTELSYILLFLCIGVAARNYLYGGIPFIAGQSVLLLGTGGPSVTVLILARAAGEKAIITSSSDEKLRYIKDKYGVDFIIETSGPGTIAKSIASIKRGGQVAVVGFLAQPSEMPDATTFILAKLCTTWSNLSIRKIALPVEKKLGFTDNQVHTALEHVQGGTYIGKVVK
ncbi:hypothetical protein BDA99DRAFT_547831 [Phascolomyces articulosus]|uniref:Alcohol dehydrogenase-like C-terminal domain-containing protein n=1 Tax=Phascolomyces articulosus TaxID=60185 RepID=A0AAD5K578_9FUNG|nr:hypothetical protein BDA99DRAFT_547831 [Phascolomyces articulosus]